MGKLTDKVALVTGGASGLGKGIAQRLAREGVKVVITDVQALLGEAVAAECGFTFFEQDVTDEARWSDLIERIHQQHGALHVLVNNAGVVGPRDAVSPEETRLADWRKIFAVNVEGVFLACRAAIPLMHASGGGSLFSFCISSMKSKI